MKVWHTKWALTVGIVEVDAWVGGELSPGRGAAELDELGDLWLPVQGKSSLVLVRASYVHRDMASAVAHADKLRRNKIASLKSQIARLEAKVYG